MIFRFTLLEKLFLRTNTIPHPLFDGLTNVIAGRSLQSAIELGIFDAISEQGSTTEEISKRIQADRRGVLALLRCLVALGYLNETGEEVFNATKRTKRFFGKNSSATMNQMVRFADIHFRKLQHLTTNVKTGIQTENIEPFSSQKEWDTFTGAMFEMAQGQAPEVAKHVPKTRLRCTILDIGGSHGLYAIEICKKLPNASAVVLDLPQM